MFTAGLAADILFYSLCEWMLYADEPHISDMGTVQDWASVYPLFHWGPIPGAFISSWLWPSASCSMYVGAAARNTRKPAVPFLEKGRRTLGTAH